MLDNLFEQSILYDIYGKILDDKQKVVYEYHVIDDLSFNEIGEELNMTRQAVHEVFKRANNKIKSYEEKLGFYKKIKNIEQLSSEIYKIASDKKIKNLSQKILKITKMEDL